MWGFESTGQDYWAEIGFPDLEKITYTPLPALNGIGFGQGFVTEGRFTYAFGGKKRGITKPQVSGIVSVPSTLELQVSAEPPQPPPGVDKSPRPDRTPKAGQHDPKTGPTRPLPSHRQ
jgi:hypothetical protein